MSGKQIVRWQVLILWMLCFLGLALRLYGLDWDQGNNFHPDERQIMFHVVSLAWPVSLEQFLDPVNSPLNPHFFAYGSLPLYLLALPGHLLLSPAPSMSSMATITLWGRVLSALFDSGTILLTGWLALLLVKDDSPGRRYAWNVALLAAALVTFTPLQLQLAHFYAVDTLLLFFVMLTLVACVKLVGTERFMLWATITALAYGLALATKVSAAPLAMPISVALLLRWYRLRNLPLILVTLVYIAVVTLWTFVITQPYVLLDWQNFVQQVSEQGSMARGGIDLPYIRQFAQTIPFIYQAQQMILWGQGLMLGLSAVAGLAWLLWRVWKRDAGLWLILLSWLAVYGVITGSFYVKFMRYMLPLYPCLALLASAALLAFVRREWRVDASTKAIWRWGARGVRYGSVVLVLGGTIFQGLALLNVYSQPNTRIQASRWIYEHLKPGSKLTYEQWDDPLPVAVDNFDPALFSQLTYSGADGSAVTGLDLYGDDTTAKARQLANLLPTVDAITMATDRLNKSIPRLPSRYPLTIHYYQMLFSGQLGFRLAAQFENRPHLAGITLDDSEADESYSVFDHPTARIFVRVTPYPYTSEQLFQKLLEGVHLPSQVAHQAEDQSAQILFSQKTGGSQPPFLLVIYLFWIAIIPLLFSEVVQRRCRGLLRSGTTFFLFAQLLFYLCVVKYKCVSTYCCSCSRAFFEQKAGIPVS
jgi:hypothetical protein